MADWYYFLNREYGPVSGAELKRLADVGTIRSDTKVKKGSTGTWGPALRVKGLFVRKPSSAQIPKPPPVPPPQQAEPSTPAPVPEPPHSTRSPVTSTAEGGKGGRGPLMAVVGSAIGLVLIVVIATLLLSGGPAIEESADQAALAAEGKSVNRPKDDDFVKRIVRIPPEEQFDEGRKWALVIGNDAYEDAPLSGPVNDAKDMASTFEELGFVVTTLTDVTQRQMEDALRAFGRSVGEGDTALFYFSGHGAQMKGVNYLLPIQADIHSEVDFRYKAIPAEMVLAQLEQAGSTTNIIILDACRSEPFKRFKSLQSGLAQMDSPAGTIIAYATAPGTVALAAGADERNSVYTKHLLRIIKTPELKVEEVFKQVRVDVVKETAGGQVPWESSSLIGEFYFAAGREREASTGVNLPRTAEPLPAGLLVTDQFTVREEDPDGPVVEGAEVELWYRAQTGGNGTLLDRSVTDATGRASVDATLSRDQQLRGEYTAVVNWESNSKESPLPGFPQSRVWTLYAPNPKVITNSIGMKLVLIPAGEFRMGSSESANSVTECEKDELPQHRVRITRAFYLGQHEVTVGQFRQFVEATGYRTDAEKDGRSGWGYNIPADAPKLSWRSAGFTQDDRHPVVKVSWNDAVSFCRWLSEKEGKECRLPTEAEWEYACRAGTTTRWWCGDDPEALARCGNIADGTAKAEYPDWKAIESWDGYVYTAPVGSFRASPWQLYDMHGNAWEWCADWHDADYYARSPLEDPKGPSSGECHVLRGGAWRYCAENSRATLRWAPPDFHRAFGVGFRVARTP